MVKGEDTVLLWSNTLQDTSGEEFQAITTDELEQLLGEIDARM